MDYLDLASYRICGKSGGCCYPAVEVGAGPIPTDFINACSRWGFMRGVYDARMNKPFNDYIENVNDSILKDVRVSSSVAMFENDCIFSIQQSYRSGYYAAKNLVLFPAWNMSY